MAHRKHPPRRDKNQQVIVDALRAVGAFVFDAALVGGGFPDLIVAYRGVVHLVEVKNPENSYGRKGLSKNQLRFDAAWQGAPVNVVWTVEEALKVIGATE
jgi:hypothetical protein